MSTHGLGGVQRLLIGSTAMKVVHAADVPVLLVRANDRKREQKETDIHSSAELATV